MCLCVCVCVCVCVCTCDESRVMTTTDPYRDPSQFLCLILTTFIGFRPGLYWVFFFSRPFQRFIQRHRVWPVSRRLSVRFFSGFFINIFTFFCLLLIANLELLTGFIIMIYNLVVSSKTGFHWVSMRFYWWDSVFHSYFLLLAVFNWTKLDFTGFYWVS